MPSKGSFVSPWESSRSRCALSTGSADRAPELAEALRGSRYAVALTGAGLSTESGIPDFRSPGGVWSKQAPVLFQDFLADPAERRRYWRMRRESYPAMAAAKPNAGHLALAELARRDRLALVITQNIDGLHAAAGLPPDKLVEIHGNARRAVCLACGRTVDADLIHHMLEAGIEDPRCESCGGIVKSATVSFGQALPPEALARSMDAARRADLFLAIGSSLQVEPAASLPWLAKQAGALLLILTRGETPLDGVADMVVREGCGSFLSRVLPLV